MQSDWHCALSFLGQDWRIRAMSGNLILLINAGGRCILDTSAVDWSAYNSEALRWDQERMRHVN